MNMKNEVKVKCIVWDLDNTLWHGVLLENDEVKLNEKAVALIKELDQRGILMSIASRNDSDKAMERLHSFGLDEYFLYPQISWNAKSHSIQKIADSLNIGIDTMAFVDDQEFELAEVASVHPNVRLVHADNMVSMLSEADYVPETSSDEAKQRRLMYLSEIRRQEAESEAQGPSEDFLRSLGMQFDVFHAQEIDLARAVELTDRTNQLNTTGITYSADELAEFIRSEHHALLAARLEDCFGSYGTIGLALVEIGSTQWTLKLFLMSCRVMSRGVGSVLLNHICNEAIEAGVSLKAEHRHSGVNRMMHVSLRFAGFQEISPDEGDGKVVLELESRQSREHPEHLGVALEAIMRKPENAKENIA